MQDISRPYLIKALESLSGADSELAGGRYNNCVNRCYYACFQAAIDALLRDGIRPQGTSWSHSFVPSQFEGQLINRRKRFGTELRGILVATNGLRRKADYAEDSITLAEARQALRQAQLLVHTIRDSRE